MGSVHGDEQIRRAAEPAHPLRQPGRFADAGEWEGLRGFCLLEYAASADEAASHGSG